MKNVKIRYWLLAALLMALAQSVSANSIDKVYTKSVSQTWGEWFKSVFQQSDFNKSYAIVIGVSRFDDFQNIGTAQDPIRMKDYLLNEAGFDYVRLITGDQVNLNKIRSIMQDEMPRTLKANDRFLFYWSGHGSTDSGNGSQFGYLPVANSRQNAFSTMLSMNDLSQWDKRLSVKQSFYLLDACFSGLAGFQVQNDSRAQTLQQIARPSRQILTAGSASEETIVIDRLGGSVFTKAVIDGLRGAADAEFRGLGRDGIVSARELSLYVQRSVAKEATQAGWHKPITPLLWNANSRSVGDFFFFTDKTVAPVIASQPRPREAGVTAQSSRVASYKVLNQQEEEDALAWNIARRVNTKASYNTYLQSFSSGKYILEAKGQLKSLKDAEYPKLISERYIDHGDGTVTDKRTNLMWKKCSEGQSGLDCTGSSTNYTWSEAKKNFRGSTSFAGYSDWRLPDVRELRSIIYCSNGKILSRALDDSCYETAFDYQRPVMNLSVFPAHAGDKLTFWSFTKLSSSYFPKGKEEIWFVNFNHGGGHHSGMYLNSLKNPIRLVRNRFK